MSLIKWIKKNPLEAAALGTAAYFTGGAALGAMGGGAAGAAGSAAGGLTAAQAAAPITEGVFAGATPAGLIAANSGAAAGGSTAGGLMSYIKPIGEAAGAAQAVGGLLGSGGGQPVQSHAPDAGNPQGSQALSQIYQQGMQMSPEDQARLQRKTMWG